MEIRTLFGLPAHPMLVHVSIVLLPFVGVGVGAVAIVVSAHARERFGMLVVVLAAVAFVGTLLAAGSGETLVDSVPSSTALREHVQLASTMRPLALLLLVVGAVVYLDRRRRSGVSAPHGAWSAAATLAIVLAIGANGWLIAVGHNGAQATWQNVRVTSGSDQGLSSPSGP